MKNKVTEIFQYEKGYQAISKALRVQEPLSTTGFNMEQWLSFPSYQRYS